MTRAAGLRRAALLGISVLGVSCSEGPSGPTSGGLAAVLVKPILPAGLDPGGFGLAIDNVRVFVRVLPSNQVIRDTVVYFPPDSAEVALALRDIAIHGESETVAVGLELRGGEMVLFTGLQGQELRRGPPGTITPVDVTLRYVGPGASIAKLSVVPRDTVITFADSLRYTVQAADSSGHPVTQFYVSWSSSDSSTVRPNAFGVVRAPARRAAVLVRALTPNGAADSTPVTFIPVPTQLVVIAGNGAVAEVGQAVTARVWVLGPDGLGVRGIPVRFTATSGGGAVRDSLVVSDTGGYAATVVTLGARSGAQVFAAQIARLAPVSFTATATAGRAAAMQVIAGSNQSAEVGTELPAALSVRVLDSLGNPKPNQIVNFVVTAGGGTTAAPYNLTNDSGVAQGRWTLGPSAGPQRLEARAVDNTSGALLTFAVFEATARPGSAASVVKVSGDAQSGDLGASLAAPLAARIVDRSGNGVVGALVTWGVTGGGGTVSPATANTDSGGVAQTQWTLGTRLDQVSAVTATSGALTGVTFTATAQLPATATLSKVQGDAQSATVATEPSDALVVTLQLADGRPVVGATIAWRVTAGGGALSSSQSTTDESGHATMRWTLGAAAGSQAVEAQVTGLTPGTVDFTAMAVAGPVATLVIGPASLTLGARGSTHQLSGTALDAYGNPVAGAPISWSSSDTRVATVSTSGLVTAVGNGTVTITATAGSVVGSASLTVSQVVAAVAVSPATVTLGALGATEQLTATVRDANGNPIAGASVTWVSSNSQVATVSTSGLVTAVGNGTATITVVSGAFSGAVAVQTAQQVAAVTVSPSAVTLAALGATQQFTATTVDANGHPVAGARVTWSSSNTQVATVDAGGSVTAVGIGSATITASVAGSGLSATTQAVTGISGIGVLTVAPPVLPLVVAVAVTPTTLSFSALGATQQLTGAALDGGGRPVAGATIAWASSNRQVATVDATGLVTAVGNGSATITATSGGIASAVAVAVAQQVAKVTVTPSAATLTALGMTRQFTAGEQDANGYAVAGTTVTWSSSNAGVATVDATGLVTAAGNGTATITATSGGVSGTATLTVAQQVAAVAVTPSAATLTAIGATQALAAATMDANRNLVSGAGVTWSSSASRVATVDATGLVTAVGNGTATITATSGGILGTALATVAQQVVTVTVAPAAVTLTALGATQRLTATVLDANGYPVSGASTAWASSAPGVASVDAAGVVTAVGNGTVTITATAGSVVGSASLTVSQVVAAVAVSPATVTLGALGATEQLTATVRDANGNPIAGASVTWVSSNSQVATVSTSGLVTAVGNGTATITATVGGLSGTARVTVVVATQPSSGVISVLISVQQSINLRSRGNVPVAILTTNTSASEPVTFDATTVDVSTVRFAGASPTRWAFEDVDGDGDLDLVLHFETQELQLTSASTQVTLTGQTKSGTQFVGTSAVRIVP